MTTEHDDITPAMHDPYAEQIAAIALAWWRSQGARTEARRDSLVHHFAKTYGVATDRPEHRAIVAGALALCRRRTRIDEIQY